MKNGNDNLKEKSMNLSQLESISGGETNQKDGVKYKINTEECIGCGVCADVCSANSFQETDNGKYEIVDSCTGCGACVDVCPVGAINNPNGR